MTGVVFCIGRVDCALVIWLLVAVGLFGVCRSFVGLRWHFLSLRTGKCGVFTFWTVGVSLLYLFVVTCGCNSCVLVWECLMVLKWVWCGLEMVRNYSCLHPLAYSLVGVLNWWLILCLITIVHHMLLNMCLLCHRMMGRWRVFQVEGWVICFYICWLVISVTARCYIGFLNCSCNGTDLVCAWCGASSVSVCAVWWSFWLCVWCLTGLLDHVPILGDVLLFLLDDLLLCLWLLDLFLMVPALLVTISVGLGSA